MRLGTREEGASGFGSSDSEGAHIMTKANVRGARLAAARDVGSSARSDTRLDTAKAAMAAAPCLLTSINNTSRKDAARCCACDREEQKREQLSTQGEREVSCSAIDANAQLRLAKDTSAHHISRVPRREGLMF